MPRRCRGAGAGLCVSEHLLQRVSATLLGACLGALPGTHLNQVTVWLSPGRRQAVPGMRAREGFCHPAHFWSHVSEGVAELLPDWGLHPVCVQQRKVHKTLCSTGPPGAMFQIEMRDRVELCRRTSVFEISSLQRHRRHLYLEVYFL